MGFVIIIIVFVFVFVFVFKKGKNSSHQAGRDEMSKLRKYLKGRRR
jgi:hypothetical protein